MRALSNAIGEGRIAQAYLFSGIRGVGKTSVARILAKALNCTERTDSAEPCDQCESCREITTGASLDVIEVDAATYSKVDQIRDLTEGLRYGPSNSKYKVVILDEIHRLSRQAFDALLKIVEEPPERLVFLFATTDVDAVPATVLSRCQEFSFRRVPADLLASHLETLCGSENITAAAGSLRRIARASEGSVRDAVALLDQLATLGQGAVDDSEVARLLGGLELAALADLFEAVAAGDRKRVSGLVSEVRAAGRDPRRAYSELLSYAREALHLAAGVTPESIDLPPDEAKVLADNVREWGYENTLRLAQHLLESEPLLRQVDSPFLALELALLRAAELPRVAQLESLLFGSASTPNTPSSQGGSSESDESARLQREGRSSQASDADAPMTEAASSPLVGDFAEDGEEAVAAEESTSAAASEDSLTHATSDPEESAEGPPTSDEPPPALNPDSQRTEPSNACAAFVEAVRIAKPAFAAHLERAEVTLVDTTFRIVHAEDDQLLIRAWQRPANRDSVHRAAREIVGASAEIELAVGTVERGARETSAAKPETQEHSDVTDHPDVQAVLDIFGGTVTSVTAKNEETANS